MLLERIPSLWANFKNWALGPAHDPLDPRTRKHMVLVAFLAWVGLGADGISSSCYGPAEAYIALGPHAHLSFYLAFAIMLTIFSLSYCYSQVIELFPTGGGGYKVASHLLSPTAGVVSGTALLVDYALTIVISIAGAGDAFFSFLPAHYQVYKLTAEFGLLGLLWWLNLRGMKESIRLLLPVFLSFMVLHLFIIAYGIWKVETPLAEVWQATWQETQATGEKWGWITVMGLFLRAYSMGGGTYTGLEAVSNNVHTLAEPRIQTGKWTMLYMALSLSFLASGLISLYLMWNIEPLYHKTLNAVLFERVLQDFPSGQTLVLLLLLSEAGLLIVGANTGFLAGPQVLANMANDAWVPKRFSGLSNQLVTQNGIWVFGGAAAALLYITKGKVSYIVVLYSINVFLTFSLCIVGLCRYQWQHWHERPNYLRSLLTAFSGLLSIGILCVTVYEKFSEGGWLTLVITSTLLVFCGAVKWHYRHLERQFSAVDKLFSDLGGETPSSLPRLPTEPGKRTAVIFAGKSKGAAIHTLLWINRLFPHTFDNFVFVTAGIVDSETFSGGELIRNMQTEIAGHMVYFMGFCQRNQLRGDYRAAFGVDPLKELIALAEGVKQEFPQSVFFASKIVHERENWWTRLLHDHLSTMLQRELHLREMQMVILPMKL